MQVIAVFAIFAQRSACASKTTLHSAHTWRHVWLSDNADAVMHSRHANCASTAVAALPKDTCKNVEIKIKKR